MTLRPAIRHVLPARLGEPRFESPLRLDTEPGKGRGQFVPESARVRHGVEIDADNPRDEELLFEKAGPRRRIFFDPAQTRVAIVVCGGLCPGINSVIRSLFLELNFNYGVNEVLGLRHGVPIEMTCTGRRQVDLEGELWSSVLAATGQPPRFTSERSV